MGNKAIEAVDNITYKENLPFPTISQENLTSLSPLELEQHLTVVYKFLQKTVLAAQSNTVVNTVVSGVLADRVNAISYLYNIATSAEVSCFILLVCSQFVSGKFSRIAVLTKLIQPLIFVHFFLYTFSRL